MKYWYDKVYKGVVGTPNCADEWLELISDVGLDYDGCRTLKSLMETVDELIEYSKNARDCLRNGKIFEDKEERERSYLEAKKEQERDV